jgi:hypothetical protein
MRVHGIDLASGGRHTMNNRREFGEQLRRHRERRGVGLATISEQTKLAPSIFVSLERGDCSRWPGGVYNRAYVRAYATAIGLDADETVAAFGRYFGDGGEFPQSGTINGGIRAQPAPLRLQLAPEPADRSRLSRRARSAFCEMALVAAAAWGLQLLTAADLAVCVASVLLTVHVVGRVAGQSIDRMLLDAVWSTRPEPELPPLTEDVPDADAAHSAA